MLKSRDFSSPNWINGDFSQLEIPLNHFRQFTSAPLWQTNLRPNEERRGWGSKGWLKGWRQCCGWGVVVVDTLFVFGLNQQWLLCWEMEQTGFKEGRLPVAWSHVTNLDQLIYRLNGLLTTLPSLYSWARVCVWGTISPGNPGPAPAFVAGEPSALRPSLSISAPSLQSSVCWLAGRNELGRQRYPWSRSCFITPINFGITTLTHDARAAMSCIYYSFGLLITSCWHHYIKEPPVVTALILEPAYFRSHFERDLL